MLWSKELNYHSANQCRITLDDGFCRCSYEQLARLMDLSAENLKREHWIVNDGLQFPIPWLSQINPLAGNC
jgi:hypothetical protein